MHCMLLATYGLCHFLSTTSITSGQVCNDSCNLRQISDLIKLTTFYAKVLYWCTPINRYFLLSNSWTQGLNVVWHHPLHQGPCGPVVCHLSWQCQEPCRQACMNICVLQGCVVGSACRRMYSTISAVNHWTHC